MKIFFNKYLACVHSRSFSPVTRAPRRGKKNNYVVGRLRRRELFQVTSVSNEIIAEKISQLLIACERSCCTITKFMV